MRKAAKTALLAVAVLVCAVVALKGSVLQVTSGTWAPTANLAQPSAGASAALLQDGRILITGGDAGNGALASADLFNMDGSVSPAAPMNGARSKHVSVTLQDGRVLVAGGTVLGGGATNAAEIYDPIANTWTSLAGGMIEARSGATAALLQDGRAAIAGGQNGNVASSTIEIFDPLAGSFSFAGTLSSPREQHAMAVLADGRVIIIGGSNGTIPVASTDILDPVAGSVAAGPSLATPRSGHSATTLLDGRVLVAAGNQIVTNPDGSTTPTDLASAEIFDPSTGTFSVAASALTTARQGHQAFLLPRNGNVLIVGGTSSGTATASAELYTPWTGAISATSPMSTARSQATGSALSNGSPTSQNDGLLLVAGGTDASSPAKTLAATELYGFATVKTDQSDYAPGTIVTITGSGWKPGETVTLSFLESPLIDTHPTLTAVADSNGNIVNTQFSPDIHDINVKFYLTATGSASQAQTTFTDGNATVSGTVTSAATGNPIQGATVSCTIATGCNATVSTTTLANGTYSFKPAFAGNGPATISVTAFATGFNTASSTPINITTNGQTITGVNFALLTSDTATVTSSANPSTFGQSATFTAKIAPATGTTVPSGTVQFKVDGANFGAPVSVAACAPAPDACATSGTISAVPVGSHTVEADFTSTTGFSSSNGTLTGGQVVNKASTLTAVTSNNNPSFLGQSITFTATVSNTSSGSSATPTGSVQFMDGASALGLPQALNGSGVATFTTTSLTVATHSITAVYSNSDGNFTGSTSSALLQVVKNAQTTTSVSSSKNPSTYGDSVTFTATVAPVDPSAGTPAGTVQFQIDNVNFGSAVTIAACSPSPSACATSGSTSTLTVPSHTITATYTPAVNASFLTSTGSITQTVNKKDATWTTNPASKTYGDSDLNPLTTGSGTNFLAADNVTATYSRTAGETVTGGPYQITATLSPSGVLSNYNITNAGASFTINTRPATWTTNPASKTYGDPDPTPLTTGSGTNFVAADNVTATYSRATGETVTGGPFQITATLSPSSVLSNYNITNTGASFTINARPATWTTNANSKTYGDGDPTPLTTGTGTNFVAADNVTASYNRAAGESVAGGPYHITATLSPAAVLSNYIITNTGASFTINARPATWTTNANSKTYGDGDPTPLTTGTGTNFVAADNVTASYNRAAGESVAGGPYHITATLSPAAVLSNYIITNTGASFTINARPATWTTNANSKTYGDGDPTPLTTGTGTNFVAADNVTASYNRAAGESVAGGPYHITATLSPAAVLSNYIITNTGASFTINARPATWTTNANSKTYGDGDPTPLTTGTGTNFVAADNVTASYNRAAGESVAGGPYHITATLSPAAVLSNYIITNTGASFTINARPATWTTNANSKTYGDGDPTPLTTGTGTNFVAADNVTASYNRAAGESVAGGPYHITATLSPAAVLSNYIITNTGASFTINARPATWTTNANSKTYGDGDPTPLTTGTGTNFVAADNVTASYNRAAGESVAGGPYHITATLSPAAVLSNYIITNTGASFTINARPATWTTNANSKTYGDGDPTPLTTGTGTNFVAADNVTASYNRAAGESVAGGPYHITATLSPAAVLSNYIITNTGASFTINARPATWTTNPNSKTYGDTDPSPLTIGSGTNFVVADNVTASYNRGAGESVAGGPYHITATLSPAAVLSNYIITNTGASFTINARPATWTTNPNSKTYGDTDPSPLTIGSGTNFVAADNVTASYNRAAGESVAGGPYHITATLSPAAVLSNYIITNTGADFTINARPATWTTNANSKTYGDGDPTPLTTGTGTNFVAADNVTASYNRAAGESVAGGPYHITATLSPAAVLSNYIITNTGASFTINARPATWTTNPNSKTYGDTDPSPLTIGSGMNFLAADGVSATYSRVAGETVSGNPYHITATLSSTVPNALSNYIITNTGASFTINARPATWTTNANSKTYGDGDPNPLTTGAGTNFVPADGVTATYSRVAGETVGGSPYHVTATLSSTVPYALNNYVITNAGADFAINARPATWTTNPNSKTYGDTDPSPLTSGSGTNFLATDGVTATYSRASGETVTGGPYHITGTLSSTVPNALNNYIIINNGASFTIGSRPATWTTNPASKTYGNPDPSPLTTGSGTNFLAADGVSATYSRALGETVLGGPYHITATLAPSAVLSNYAITNAGASFTINPANTMTSVSTWTPNPSVYDQAITITATVSNASTPVTVNEGTIAFTADAAMTPLCTTGPVLGGAASCTAGSLNLAVGGHTIVATYVPGPDFFGSGSSSVPQAVNPRHTSVAITSTEISNFMTGSVPINTLVDLQVTVTDDDTNGTPITPTGTFSITSLIASDTFSLPTDGSGNGLCTLSGSGASASCSLAVTPVEADQHILTANYPGDSVHLASTQMADMMVTAPLVSQKVCLSAPFNGQAIPAGSTVWFNAVFQTTGQKITTLTHLTFYNQTIQVGTGTPMPVPDGVITFDPTATLASTTFDAVNNRWNTTLPTYNLAGKNWLSGMPVRFPFGLAASTAPVTWCGQFASDSSTIALGWQWAAAVYTNFVSFDPNNPSDLSGVGVKSVDDNKADVNYKNSDHAGTPEKYLQFVIGGARGGGGGNYTGGYSGSGNLK